MKLSEMSSCDGDFVAKPSLGAPPSKSSVFSSVSVSSDEIMSSFDSLKSSSSFELLEYIYTEKILEVESIEKITTHSLCISDQFVNMEETRDKVFDIDHDSLTVTDPQFCATIACDIYKHLRQSEANRMPSFDYMDTIQKEIKPGMRAVLIDWLVSVAAVLKLVPETLFLAVNYIDRYLSDNLMDTKRLQLLGVTCLMIAAKYEETQFHLQVEWFSAITKNTYLKEEILQMESAVLRNLKYEMAAPTVMCFLRRFCFAAQETSDLPCYFFDLASYIAELSLVEYGMLYYSPSLIAASAVFLAKYILYPSKKPWNSTLRRYTLYQASDLCDCVEELHHLYRRIDGSKGGSFNLTEVRNKYCQPKYNFVPNIYCHLSIPPEFFQDF